MVACASPRLARDVIGRTGSGQLSSIDTIVRASPEFLSILNALRKVAQSTRLGHIAVCAQPESRRGKLEADPPTDHNDAGVGMVGPYVAQHFKPSFARHSQVKQHQSVGLLLHLCDGLGTIGYASGNVSHPLQELYINRGRAVSSPTTRTFLTVEATALFAKWVFAFVSTLFITFSLKRNGGITHTHQRNDRCES